MIRKQIRVVSVAVAVVVGLLAAFVCMPGASDAVGAELRKYDISTVGAVNLDSLTVSTASGEQKTLEYVTPDGETVAGDQQFTGDSFIRIGLVFTIDLQNVKPGDIISVPFHTTDDSYAPIYPSSFESSGYLLANGQRVFTVKSTEADHLTLTALNSVSKLTGTANMSLTLNGNIYPGRSTHFGRTSTAFTVGDKTYTIPNPKQTVSANWNNAARAIGVSSTAGAEILMLAADTYGWQNSILAGNQYADIVQKNFNANRVVLAKITPQDDAEIESITPKGGIVPDDVAAGYNATTWSSTYIEGKSVLSEPQLATLTVADMLTADKVAAKLPAHQAAIVQNGNTWYVAVNFGAIADDPKLSDSQSGYGDETTEALYDNVRAKGLPYPSMTMSFTVKFNDPSKTQTAKVERWANTEWKSNGVQNQVFTKVYHTGWDLATTPTSDASDSDASSAVTVSFDANEGTAVDSQKVKSGDTVAEPYTQRDGYVFGGWYLNGSKYDFTLPVTTDITLKAVWVTVHTVSFDTAGGETMDAQTVADGDTANDVTPTREGYTFDGWYLNGSEYDFATPVTSNLTLKAAWRKTGTSLADATLSKRVTRNSGSYTVTLSVTGSRSDTTRMSMVTITDPLSDWVDPVGLKDGKADGVTVTRDGKVMTGGCTAVYSSKSRTVTVTFDDALADKSVYAVMFDVKPNTKATLAYMTSGEYPDTGDKDTGDTSSGVKGYRSNGEATLSWDAVSLADGTPTTVPSVCMFAKPVVQFLDGLPPVLVDLLPGTGVKTAIVPIVAGVGVMAALACAWIIRRRLERQP